MSEDLVPTRNRVRLLAEADSLFALAEEREANGIASPESLVDFTEEAMRVFHAAAIKYRDLGFGLAARQAWDRASWCCRALAKEQVRAAQKFDELMDTIPVLWGEELEGGSDERRGRLR
jgi:hypothetical protein